MTLTETLPILQAIADGEPWQFRGRTNWFDADNGHDPVYHINCGQEIRLTPKPDKWAAEKAAFAEGKQIEIRQFYPRTAVWSQWALIKSPMFKGNDNIQYRIAPSPTCIPLGPEDVPPGSVLCYKSWGTQTTLSWVAVMQVASSDGVLVAETVPRWYGWKELVDTFTILRPNSTVWEECRKEAK